MIQRMSHLFQRSLRDAPADAETLGHQYLLRAGYVRRVSPGVYSWLPLGLAVLRRVETVIREEMASIGAQEVALPALLPRAVFDVTGRWEEYGETVFKLADRRENEHMLGPTHEEFFTLAVKDMYSSYKDFPVTLFQVQNKFRDELRSRGGLLRGREFVMKDSYSFDLDEDGLDASYAAHRAAYERVLTRLNVPYSIVQATAGAMGGSASEEFLVPLALGEDTFVQCRSCSYAANVEVHGDSNLTSCPDCGAALVSQRGIEIGHIFKLGAKYTEALGFSVAGADGKLVVPLMGCYGIGVSRMVAVLAELGADAKGLRWPLAAAPFDVHITVTGRGDEARAAAEMLASNLSAQGLAVLLDDREGKIGPAVKLKDSELIGVPIVVVVGRDLAQGQVELRKRWMGETNLVELSAVSRDLLYR